jgi:indolepyruvate ferredoxin oxidoreductase
MLDTPRSEVRVSLDDKYLLERGEVFLSGTQALVRLLLEQRRRDRRRGLDTAGFVSGYRGSPLGGVDLALWRAADLLREHRVHFEPGLNEELAVTMVHGSQQVEIVPRDGGLGPKVEGVFGLWYGKHPGLDRAGDALRHGNAAGTAPYGGVLAVSGDDPGAASSSIPNQCEQNFAALLMPVLSPASVAEIVELGLAGYALSRFSGLWVGFKTVADVIESTASVRIDPDRADWVLPAEVARPPGIGIRHPDSRWDSDERVLSLRLPAARAFAHANRLDRVVLGAERPRLGLVTSGKATQDVRQALADLGVDDARARALGLGVFKVAMVWPLEPQAIGRFAQGAAEVLCIEERRAFVETQLKDLAYHWPADRRPAIVGKTDPGGAPLLPEGGELSAVRVARAIGARMLALGLADEALRERLAALDAGRGCAAAAGADVARVPHFCAGCPHSRSTQVPEGALAMGGIGCHSLRLWMPPGSGLNGGTTQFMVQMGGEGSNWLGIAPFVGREHVFQNLGDGTYTHSGSLAIRAAVAARRNVTYRILYNDAVAMTGGQPAEGALSVAQITHQLHGEGLARIAVVAEDPGRHRGAALAPGVEVHPRDAMPQVQEAMRHVPGVTAIVYDQACATEKRRRRKRGEMPQAARVFINERVCEGCGDCVQGSNCAAVMPVETPLGTKRRIDQSSCNQDASCLVGFCPSFVTVEGRDGGGVRLRRAPAAVVPAAAPREVVPPALDRPHDILVNGIGGTGVITVGAILGMAAHLEGRGCSVLDNTGIARKGGAVSTHVRLAPTRQDVHATRIGEGRASLVIGCDLLVSAESATLSRIAPGGTRVLLNTDAVPTLNQRLDPQLRFDARPLERAVRAAAGDAPVSTVRASAIAERLLGDAIFANMLMLGWCWQCGWVPLALASIDRAIELNGNAVEANRRAFALGRQVCDDPAPFEALLAPPPRPAIEDGLDAMLARRERELVDYQGPAIAARYRERVLAARQAEARLGVTDETLARAVAHGYFRLLAIKDEYEVARLHTDGALRRALAETFEGEVRVRWHLAPPLLSRRDPATGRLVKRAWGPAVEPLMRWLARLRWLRGTPFDVFGYTAERRMERRLVVEYEAMLDRLLPRLTVDDHAIAVELAMLPDRMRGYGHVKGDNVARAKAREAELVARLA